MPGCRSATSTSRNKQFGIYVQDDWEVNEHLLLNLGVRWDYEETPSYLDYVTPADVVAAQRVDPAPACRSNIRATLALGASTSTIHQQRQQPRRLHRREPAARRLLLRLLETRAS